MATNGAGFVSISPTQLLLLHLDDSLHVSQTSCRLLHQFSFLCTNESNLTQTETTVTLISLSADSISLRQSFHLFIQKLKVIPLRFTDQSVNIFLFCLSFVGEVKIFTKTKTVSTQTVFSVRLNFKIVTKKPLISDDYKPPLYDDQSVC